MSDTNSKQLDAAIIVIFGMTGDLSKRYLLPSLYYLFKDGVLNERTRILGVTRGDTSVDQVFDKVQFDGEEKLKQHYPEALQKLKSSTSMFKMDLDNQNAYEALLRHLNELEDSGGTCMNRLYYLSIPPRAYQPVISMLGNARLNTSCQHDKAATRLLVEKPFGYDLSSAKNLIDDTRQFFNEKQTFRIDHYMAKETIQNILKFRFQNPEFDAIWDNQHISGVEVIAKQKIGIEGRAVFYEPLGALRDFIQSHLIQILGIITMQKPDALDSDHIHANKQAALDQIKPVDKSEVEKVARRGQYSGYREEVNNPESTTETFAEVTLFSSAERWQDIPIKLLTGKGLDEKKTEIRIDVKGASSKEKLVFSIDQEGHPNAYEKVLVDAIRGDHTLFATSDEILASWRILQPVLDAWGNNSDDLVIYEPGTPGPATGDF